MENSMGKAKLFGQMEVSLKGTLLMERGMEKANISQGMFDASSKFIDYDNQYESFSLFRTLDHIILRASLYSDFILIFFMITMVLLIRDCNLHRYDLNNKNRKSHTFLK